MATDRHKKTINRQNIGNKEKRNDYGGSKEVQRGATDHKQTKNEDKETQDDHKETQ